MLITKSTCHRGRVPPAATCQPWGFRSAGYLLSTSQSNCFCVTLNQLQLKKKKKRKKKVALKELYVGSICCVKCVQEGRTLQWRLWWTGSCLGLLKQSVCRHTEWPPKVQNLKCPLWDTLSVLLGLSSSIDWEPYWKDGDHLLLTNLWLHSDLTRLAVPFGSWVIRGDCTSCKGELCPKRRMQQTRKVQMVWPLPTEMGWRTNDLATQLSKAIAVALIGSEWPVGEGMCLD